MSAIKDLERQILQQVAEQSEQMFQEPPKVIEIDSSDIEKVVWDVIDNENIESEKDKQILMDTVYESLWLGDDRLTNLLKVDSISKLGLEENEEPSKMESEPVEVKPEMS